MERQRFGFFPELRTPQLPAAHVRAGTGLEHWPEAMPPTSSALQPASSLAPCDLVSHDLSPVLHREHFLSPAHTAEPEDPQRGSDFAPSIKGQFQAATTPVGPGPVREYRHMLTLSTGQPVQCVGRKDNALTGA
jgi:hypothetical protein